MPSGVKMLSHSAPAAHIGANRQTETRGRHVRDVGGDPHQLRERRHFPTPEDVGAASRGGHGAAETESGAQIVDVRDVIVVPAGSRA